MGLIEESSDGLITNPLIDMFSAHCLNHSIETMSCVKKRMCSFSPHLLIFCQQDDHIIMTEQK